MSAHMGRRERAADDGGHAMDDIGEATTLLAEEEGAGLGGRVESPEDRAGLAQKSADHAERVEGPGSETSTDHAAPDESPAGDDSAREDSVSMGTGADTPIAALFAPAPDDRMFQVERARVLEAMFQVPAEPQRLGRYVVLGTLGQGGMGTVLEAFDRTLDRKVAVKVLHQELDEKHTARLLREAQAMAKLSHPNVVPVFDADRVGGQTFVAMELVQGQTLEAWMRQEPRPDWRQCVKVFIQAGQGLAAAHAQGLVHRDFKPSNAIVDDEGRTRVLDFGLARWTEVDPTDDEGLGRAGSKTKGDPSVGTRAPQRTASRMMRGRTMRAQGNDEPALDQALTRTGAVLGTPAYMPPEQMLDRRVDTRSDQFSFCVALYEAVYGERPFEGRSVAALMAAMTSGEVRPAPKGCSVPARLRAVLLRGLTVQPAKRWPSMAALLTQLRTLVAPRTRRWMALGVTAGLAALGGGLAMPQLLEMQDRCSGAPAQMDGLWDHTRRQQVQAAILGTEVSFALGTWDRIEPRLDAYAQAWIDTHTEACEATRVHGDQTPEEMSLRMRCLDRRRTALRATVDQLVDADANATVVTNAVELVAGLPTLTRCNDLAWLEQQNQRVPPPEDPDVAAAVEAQRARLADIAAMGQANRYAEALDAVEPVVQQAEALGYPALRAEALYRRGRLRHGNGEYAKAEEDLRQAHTLAVQHHHDPIALDTAQLLTLVVGALLERHTEGQQWGEMVALPLAQSSGDPAEEADSLGLLGSVLHGQGDYENMRIHFERALAIRENVLGPDHPHVATSLNLLGDAFRHQGDHENARVHFERALAISEKTLGPAHPDTAIGLGNLGNVFLFQGDYEDARVHYERASVILEKALGPDHPDLAKTLNNLGTVFESQGDMAKARARHERALAIREKALSPDHPDVATSLNNLGIVLEGQGELENALIHHQRALAIREKALGTDHPRVALSLSSLASVFHSQGELENARVHYQRALAIQEKALGTDHPHVAYSHNNLGNVFVSQGELEKARVHIEQALAIREKVLGPDHPHVASPLVGLATVALETGDPASARAHAERAVSIREATTVGPALLAEARFVLARALWHTHSERARARALAEQARDALAAAEGPGDSGIDLDETEAWLAEHRVH